MPAKWSAAVARVCFQRGASRAGRALRLDSKNRCRQSLASRRWLPWCRPSPRAYRAAGHNHCSFDDRDFWSGTQNFKVNENLALCSGFNAPVVNKLCAIRPERGCSSASARPRGESCPRHGVCGRCWPLGRAAPWRVRAIAAQEHAKARQEAHPPDSVTEVTRPSWAHPPPPGRARQHNNENIMRTLLS
jgi:hypothetical protein